LCGEGPPSDRVDRKEERGMFKKLFVLMVAASALGACNNPSDSLPPTTPAQPASAPASYMTFFELGSTKLSDQSMATITQASQVYKTKTNANVVVIGYADTVGSPAMNMQLSQRRASAVRDALVAGGVPVSVITTTANGDTSLLVDTGPQANQPKNRRVQIVVN
jgi:outer membrane protein OmpA-like peptidoglycan-associated protein